MMQCICYVATILGIAALRKCHIQQIQQATIYFPCILLTSTISSWPLRWCASAILLLSRWAASHCPWHPTWCRSCFDSFFQGTNSRCSMPMHAYRKWRACWPCICLVFDVPFSKLTLHASCVECEGTARAWETSHAWLWTCSGILQSKDANANWVPLLLRNEKTQPRFMYHMGMCAVCHSISFLCIIWDEFFKNKILLQMSFHKNQALLTSLYFLSGVFISACCPNATQSPNSKKNVVDDFLLHKKSRNQNTFRSVWYNRIVYGLVS